MVVNHAMVSAHSLHHWFGDGICRYCSLPVNRADAVVAHSYWQGMKFVSHKACKVAGEKAEALECQAIDADCNDCRHYKRGKLAARVVSILHRPDGTTVEVSHQPNIFVGGHCLKLNKPTSACPNKWTGHECFEHRRGKSPNAEVSDRRAHGNDNTTGANGGSIH